MKKLALTFLQILFTILGFGVFVFLLWEPHLEGRNAHATLFEIYFRDPFLLYAYTASIAFFIGVYQLIKILGDIKQNQFKSATTISSLRITKYCALTLICLTVEPVAYLFIARPGDDIAGGVAMGLVVILFSGIVSVISSKLIKSA